MTQAHCPTLLADLDVTRSHSRPRVSNECPYPEAQLYTLRYLPNFPARFTSLVRVRQFCAGFFHEYNYVHHSGIGWRTAASVPIGVT
jgi:putative transposase